jgi:hypothetical protein
MLRRTALSTARLAGGRAGEVRSSSGATEWLRLAAAPTFAAMAVLTAFVGEAPDAICSVQGAPLLAGMTPMYFLMAVFHATPWLSLFPRGRIAR